MSRPKPKPKLRCGGIFTADLTVPADPLDRTGRRYCICGLNGQAGDTHHPLPEAVDDMRSRAAGERSDG